MAITAATRSVRVGVRGPGGEIGNEIPRILMGMSRPKFEVAKGVMGGELTGFIRAKNGSNLVDTIRGDRAWAKLAGEGDLTQNTLSPYHYAGVISGATIEADGRVKVVGSDGRELMIKFVPIPDSNRPQDVPALANIDLLLDTTGEGLKDIKNPDQDPNLYADFENLSVLFSAPVKTVRGIPHLLAGVDMNTPSQLNATGSCTTHAGVILLKAIITALGLTEENASILDGSLDTTHSLTPTDMKIASWYNGGTVMQTTGFGGAAGKVYSFPGVKEIDATTRRYNSFHMRNGVAVAAGTSTFSLSLTLAVRNAETLSLNKLSDGLLSFARANQDRVGIISDQFDPEKNKNNGIFTTLGLSGLPQTVMLPLGENIKLKQLKLPGALEGYSLYSVKVLNAGYDNRFGFTGAYMQEANQVAQARFGIEWIPGFSLTQDIGETFAFIRTEAGSVLFAKALQATGGNLLRQFNV